MKYKIFYIYISLLLILITFLFFFDSSNTSTKQNSIFKSDINSVHDNPNLSSNPKPSKRNVNKDIFHKLEKFKEAIDNNPADTLMIRKYAELLVLSHKSSDALKYYNLILKIDSKRVDVLFELSFIYFSKLNYNLALKTTEKILEIEPENLKAKYNSGAIFASKGNKKEAKRIWDLIVSKNAGSKQAKLAAESLKKLN